MKFCLDVYYINTTEKTKSGKFIYILIQKESFKKVYAASPVIKEHDQFLFQILEGITTDYVPAHHEQTL